MRIFWGSCMVLAGWLASCVGEPPGEAALRLRLVGTYCGGPYVLRLSDSVYFYQKKTTGIFGTPDQETCQGRYHLEWRGDTWYLQFEAAQPPYGSFYDCEAQYAVWNRREGYLIGGDTLRLRDLLDGQPVWKGSCGY
ncbi:MAG: hypothetical protein SF053_06455 [Bacteroidia bacterium]|nr:hypothetical protein [Bacteroidia bacterium]